MAKRKDLQKKLNKKLLRQTAPHIEWKRTSEGHVPIIFVGNIAIPLSPRKFKGYYQGEQGAIMAAVKQCLSEVLFGVPQYLIHPETGAFAPNPDWSLQKFWMKNPNAIGEYLEIEPQPSVAQIAAGEELPTIK